MFINRYFRGWKVIDSGQGLIRLRHMKSYDGLLQSSFMFFMQVIDSSKGLFKFNCMQIVVLFTRPSFGTQWGIPNGKCEST